MLDGMESPHVAPVLQERLQDLCASFSGYLEVFKQHCPFSESQLGAHLKALKSRSAFLSAGEAVTSSDFVDAVRDMLILWMGNRGGIKVVPPEAFRAELGKLAAHLADLDQRRIDDASLDEPKAASMIWDLINSMCLVTKQGDPVRNRLVSGTKALHHVLPKLVFPIDREYTQTFFGLSTQEFQYNPRDSFALMFLSFANLAAKVHPAQYVADRWFSSSAKILDNAVVGYCLKHGLKSKNRKYQQKRSADLQALKKHLREVGM